MNSDLSRRIAFAFNTGRPFPEDRDRIIRAAEKATDFSSLPPRVQDDIRSLSRGQGGVLTEED